MHEARGFNLITVVSRFFQPILLHILCMIWVPSCVYLMIKCKVYSELTCTKKYVLQSLQHSYMEISLGNNIAELDPFISWAAEMQFEFCGVEIEEVYFPFKALSKGLMHLFSRAHSSARPRHFVLTRQRSLSPLRENVSDRPQDEGIEGRREKKKSR